MFDAKLVEFELTLSDPVHESDAGDGRRGSSKMLEAEHRTKPQLDRSMVLFNQIVDVFGDAANYAISLGVAGMALTWRARAAQLKGWSLGLLGAAVLLSTAWHAYTGALPKAETMGVVGVLALLANGSVALMLYRFRTGDANMRSVWICSRNDAIGNLAVLAAAGVFGTGTAWPDLIVATIMAALGVSGGWQIVRHAHADLRRRQFTPLGAAR